MIILCNLGTTSLVAQSTNDSSRIITHGWIQHIEVIGAHSSSTVDEVSLFSEPYSNNSAMISNDGKKLIYWSTSPSSAFYISNLDQSDKRVLYGFFQGDESPSSYSISNDLNQIAYINSQGIFIINLETGSRRQLLSQADVPDGGYFYFDRRENWPKFSPDGTKLLIPFAFSGDPLVQTLYLKDLSTNSDLVKLTFPENDLIDGGAGSRQTYDEHADWQSSGNKILFLRRRIGVGYYHVTIYAMDLGNQEKTLEVLYDAIESGFLTEFPKWSPDNTKIAVTRRTPAVPGPVVYGLYTMNVPDGSFNLLYERDFNEANNGQYAPTRVIDWIGYSQDEDIIVNSVSDRPNLSNQSNCTTGETIEVDNELVPECTLRAAIMTLNTRARSDSISFNIVSDVSRIIELNSPLPVAEHPFILDATTQPGYTDFPLISISGKNEIEYGLVLNSDDSVVRGLSIGGFTEAGILISGGSGNSIEANHIGIDASGLVPFPNRTGLIIDNSSDNVIGGFDPKQMNVISGNIDSREDVKMSEEMTGIGVMIKGTESTGNIVQGNRIGTNISGMQAIGNGYVGLYIYNASSNIIGGDSEEMGNLISGNRTANVQIYGKDAVENTISGNLIGTNGDGSESIGENETGISIVFASRNRIGGSSDYVGKAPGNVISGNRSAGIVLVGVNPEILEQGSDVESGIASDNVIAGNLIGTNKNGTESIPNQVGILAAYDAHKTQIGGSSSSLRNVISGNQGAGIILADTTGGLAPHESIIAGNYIGTDITGSSTLGNGGVGIQFATLSSTVNELTGISGVIIGGSDDGARNVIAGNANHQIEIFGPLSAGTQILNNYIGILTDGSAGQDPSDSEYGILVKSNEVFIGVDHEGNSAGNTISGNKYGILLGGNENLVSHNYIGTNSTSSSAVPNDTGIFVLGDANVIMNNTVSGNTNYGIVIGQESGSPSFEGRFFDPEMTIIFNNHIGTNAQGSESVGNGTDEQGAGIVFWRGKSLQIYMNIISGNYHGIQISNSAFEDGTRIAGNIIGAGGVEPIQLTNNQNILELVPIPNRGNGVDVLDGKVYISDQFVYDELSNVLLGNFILNNMGAGVRRSGSNLNSVFEVTSNTFFGNMGLAIDFGSEGVGSDDNLHQPPILLPPVFTTDETAIIRGSSTADGTVQFYSSPICHPSGYGEGRSYLKGEDLQVYSSQEFSISIDNPDNLRVGFYITALVTSGNRTSEFSRCLRIVDEDLYMEGLLDDLAEGALELLELTLSLSEENQNVNFSKSNNTSNTEKKVFVARYDLPPDINQFEGSATSSEGNIIQPVAVEENQYWVVSTNSNEVVNFDLCIRFDSLELLNSPKDLVILHRAHDGYPWTPYHTTINSSSGKLCAYGLQGFGDIALGSDVNQPVSITTEDFQIPSTIRLHQNYPNPFNPTTQIRFELPESQRVSIRVYDISGKLVSELATNQSYAAGIHQITFDGSGLSTGVYVYNLSTDSGYRINRKFVFIK